MELIQLATGRSP